MAEREAKLKKLEEEIRKVGGFRRNNWPVCFPIWHHDIAGEIPDEAKRVVREVYMSWWVSTNSLIMELCSGAECPIPKKLESLRYCVGNCYLACGRACLFSMEEGKR